MSTAGKLLGTFLEDDRAATSIEYGLIASGISIAAALVLLQVGASVTAIFEQARDAVTP